MNSALFIDVMDQAGNDRHRPVYVNTCRFAKTVNSTFDVPALMDKTLDEIVAGDRDALAIPGGFEELGFYEEACDERVLNLIRAFHGQGKPIPAVCAAALPPGKSGVLKNRRAATYRLNGGHRQKQLAGFEVNV